VRGVATARPARARALGDDEEHRIRHHGEGLLCGGLLHADWRLLLLHADWRRVPDADWLLLKQNSVARAQALEPTEAGDAGAAAGQEVRNHNALRRGTNNRAALRGDAAASAQRLAMTNHAALSCNLAASVNWHFRLYITFFE